MASSDSNETLLIRIDERQQALLQRLDSYEERNQQRFRHIEVDVARLQSTVRDVKVGFGVISFLASVGALVLFQWESFKDILANFVKDKR